MSIKTFSTRGAKGSLQVEALVQKARARPGVERILVVYEEKTARIYVEDEAPARPRPSARAV